MLQFLSITHKTIYNIINITKFFVFGTIIFLTWWTLIKIKNQVKKVMKPMILFIITNVFSTDIYIKYIAPNLVMIPLKIINFFILFKIIVLKNMKSAQNTNLKIINKIRNKTRQENVSKKKDTNQKITKEESNNPIIPKKNVSLRNKTNIWVVHKNILCLFIRYKNIYKTQKKKW